MSHMVSSLKSCMTRTRISHLLIRKYVIKGRRNQDCADRIKFKDLKTDVQFFYHQLDDFHKNHGLEILPKHIIENCKANCKAVDELVGNYENSKGRRYWRAAMFPGDEVGAIRQNLGRLRQEIQFYLPRSENSGRGPRWTSGAGRTGMSPVSEILSPFLPLLKLSQLDRRAGQRSRPCVQLTHSIQHSNLQPQAFTKWPDW